jgi:hypothetical protein
MTTGKSASDLIPQMAVGLVGSAGGMLHEDV